MGQVQNAVQSQNFKLPPVTTSGKLPFSDWLLEVFSGQLNYNNLARFNAVNNCTNT